MNIASNAVLVRPTFTMWQGTTRDTAAALEVQQAFGTKIASHKVTKTLLPGGTGAELQMMWSLLNASRSYVYSRTLRWINRGELLLPLTLCTEFFAAVNEQETKVTEFFNNVFLPAYPKRIIEAQHMLQKSYNIDDYPTIDQLRNRFRFSVPTLPIPDVNQLSALIGEDKAQETQELLNTAMQDALTDAYERVYQVVKHMHEKLADPKAIFRDTLVENAKELRDVLPKLNFSNDPLLTEMCNGLVALTGRTPDELRDSPYARSTTAEKAKKMLDRMAGLNLNVK